MNSETPTFVSDYLVPKVGKTAKMVSMMVKSHFIGNNIPLTKEQFIVLLCLEEGFKSQSFLAMVTERDKGSLTRLIQSLEKKGYVKRTISAEDSRVNEVELTSKGKVILEETKPVMKKLFSIVQQGIKESEMVLATQVLEKMQRNVMNVIEKIEEAKK
ncbi:MAG: DNA-binding MarR family transcriptional regulator [Vicingaceae bacterium]